MHIRRIVTGQKNGRAAIVADDQVAPVRVALVPGGEFHKVWGGDETPRLPAAGEPVAARAWYPPRGGYRFAFVTIPPEGPPPAGLDLGAAIAELETKLPGLAQTLEPDAP